MAKGTKEPKEPKAKKTKRMTYTDSMIETLLTLVIATGAHLASGHKSTTKWAEVYNSFFLDKEVLPFKEAFYKVDPDGKVNPRNLRDKYNEIIVSVGKDKETGNQSGKEGDLSQTYKLVQQITDEMDEAEAEKDYLKTERAEDKVKLEGNEASILGKRQRNSAIGTVNADGTVTVDEERAARRAARTSGNLTGFEKSLFEMLNNDNNDSSSSSTTIVAKNLAYYSDIEEKMRRFCEMKGYNLDTLVVEAYAPTQEDAPQEVNKSLRAIGGLSCIINYYCASDGKFEPKEFTAVLKDMEISPLVSRLIHVVLSKWRTSAMLLPPPGITVGVSPAALSAVTPATTVDQTPPASQLPRGQEEQLMEYDCSANADMVFESNDNAGGV